MSNPPVLQPLKRAVARTQSWPSSGTARIIAADIDIHSARVAAAEHRESRCRLRRDSL